MRSTWTDSRLDDLNGRVTEIRDDMGSLGVIATQSSSLGSSRRRPGRLPTDDLLLITRAHRSRLAIFLVLPGRREPAR
jgi:hypothetical protein